MNIQEVAKQTADIVIRYYQNDIQPFLDACDEDVLWIGPAENQIIRTREALVAAFAAEKNDLRFEVYDLRVIPVSTTNNHVCEIVLIFTVDTIWPDNSVNRVKQRIQLTVVERRGAIRLRLCLSQMRSCMMNVTRFIRSIMSRITRNLRLPGSSVRRGFRSRVLIRRSCF